MQFAYEHTTVLPIELSTKQLFKILNSKGEAIHSFYKRNIDEAEMYFSVYCRVCKLNEATHILMSVGA